MKRAIKIASRISAVLLVIIFVSLAIGPKAHSIRYPELPADELAALENKAVLQGDKASAAKLYWYYRLTMHDFVRARKWEYAVLRPGETNSDLPSDSSLNH